MSSIEAAHWDEEFDHPDGVDSRVWSNDHPDGVEFCLNMIRPCLPGAGKVLELGCGVGRLTIPVAERFRGLSLVGLDVSPKMLAEARARTPVATTNLSYALGDGRTIPFGPGTLNGAYSVVTLQHIPDDGVLAYLGEISNALVRGGKFTFQFTVGTEDSGYSHCRPTQKVLSWVTAAGFRAFIHDEGVGDQVWAWCTAVKA